MTFTGKSGLFWILLFSAFLSLSTAQGETIDTCSPNAMVTIGSYVVGTNYWNPRKCPGKQCLSIDNETGKFTVTKADFTCAPDVASYPFIFYGSHFGTGSPGTVLPMPLTDLKCVTSSWSFTPARNGSWDAAYDIWFSRGLSTAGGFRGGAEMMLWLDYMGNVPPAGQKIGRVTIDGMGWTLWEGNIGWNYIAYLADKTVDSVDSLDLMAFLNDSLSRGYLDKDWYLAAVEAGNELRTGGVPFTSNSFSVAVNKGCGRPGAKPTATPGGKGLMGVPPMPAP